MRLSHAQAFQLRKLSRLCNYYYLKREIEKKKQNPKKPKKQHKRSGQPKRQGATCFHQDWRPLLRGLVFFSFSKPEFGLY
jgi:hypothetical protein